MFLIKNQGLTIPMCLISFSFGLSRPLSNKLVLEQINKNTGAASSMLIFIYFILGTVHVAYLLDFSDKISVIGILGAVSVVLCFLYKCSFQKN